MNDSQNQPVTEPIYYSETFFLGDVQVDFRGEQWGHGPIQDTSVKIGDLLVCWITWGDKKKFMEELNSIITKYRI